MIIETIFSTLDEKGRPNFAPMGVVWGETEMIVRPFCNTTTYRNLVATGYGVANVTDNVLSFARSALSKAQLPHFPACYIPGVVLDEASHWRELEIIANSEWPLRVTDGEWPLRVADGRWHVANGEWPLRVASCHSERSASTSAGHLPKDAQGARVGQQQTNEESPQRAEIRCRVVGVGWQRDLLGFNRAKSTLIEAIILATRLHLYSQSEVWATLQRCDEIVSKTGGEQERKTMQYVHDYVKRWFIVRRMPDDEGKS